MSGPDFTAQRERDREEMEAIRRHRVATLKAFALTLAIVVAPFVALLYSVDLALAVLALALGFTTWLTWQGASMVGPAQRSKLKVAAGLNAVIALVTVVILVLRLTSS
jgi:hypothetical protein